MENSGISAKEQHKIQFREQHRRGLCTTSQFDAATQTWHWCQNRQHTRGKKKKCLSCLAASSDLNEKLIAQGFCKCKQGHPEGRGCPDRFLREGRIHLITQEQRDWNWRQILTANGKINLEDKQPLTEGQQAHLNRCLTTFRELLSSPPSSMADFERFVRRLTVRREMSRNQRNWMIVAATMYHEMWGNPEIDLKRKVQIARSQAIKDGMEAARIEGRSPGRPRIQK